MWIVGCSTAVVAVLLIILAVQPGSAAPGAGSGTNNTGGGGSSTSASARTAACARVQTLNGENAQLRAQFFQLQNLGGSSFADPSVMKTKSALQQQMQLIQTEVVAQSQVCNGR